MLTGLDAVFASSVITGHSVEFSAAMNDSGLFGLAFILAVAVVPIALQIYTANRIERMKWWAFPLITVTCISIVLLMMMTLLSYQAAPSVTASIATNSKVKSAQISAVFEEEFSEDVSIQKVDPNSTGDSLTIDDYNAEVQEFSGVYAVSDESHASGDLYYRVSVDLDGNVEIEEQGTV